MSNFRIGQKVVCVVDCGWQSDMGRNHNGPKQNELLIIDFFDIEGGLGFMVYDTIEGYEPSAFRPLDEILREQSESDLSRIEKEINEQIPVEV